MIDGLEVGVNSDEDLEEEHVRVDFETAMSRSGRGKTKAQLEEMADDILRADSNRELCRKCKEAGHEVPYGEKTGNVYPMPQFADDGTPMLDDDGAQLVVDFPELECERSHRWFQGEGLRRQIKGPNPILFESHIHNRKRREIYPASGVPDSALVRGTYNKTHPQGRGVNTAEQRKKKKTGPVFSSNFYSCPCCIILTCPIEHSPTSRHKRSVSV